MENTDVWRVLMHRESGSIVSEGLDESPQGAVGALVPRTEVGLLYRDTHGLKAHSDLGRTRYSFGD